MALGELEVAFLEGDGAVTRDALGRALELEMRELASLCHPKRLIEKSRPLRGPRHSAVQGARAGDERR